MAIPDKAITRNEQYLAAMAGQSGTLPDAPITRKERYLAKAAGQSVETPEPITREEMYLDAIAEGGGGGGDITLTTLNVSANGTTNAPSGTAYNKVVASVSNTYAADDEGKVVSNGALVPQTSDTVTANDTYDTTLINSLTVNVAGAGQTQLKLLASGAYTNASGNTLDIPFSLPAGSVPWAAMVNRKGDPPDSISHVEWFYMRGDRVPGLADISYTGSVQGPGQCYVRLSGGAGFGGSTNSCIMMQNETNLHCVRANTSFPIGAGTFKWYIWGFEA